jgi:outer membrane protein assembly factor BamE
MVSASLSMPRFPLPLASLALAALAGCAADSKPGSLHAAPGLPALAVYRADVLQGNVITPDLLAALQPGMSRERVRAVLGTPMLEDPFHPERWDYLYSERHAYQVREQRHVTLYFDGDRLDYIAGDVVPTPGARYHQLLAANTRTTINVPPAPPPAKGLLERIGRRVGLVDPPPPKGYDLGSYVATDEPGQYGAVTGEPEKTLGPPANGPTFVSETEAGAAPASPAQAQAAAEQAEAAQGAPDEEAPGAAAQGEAGLFDGLLDRIGL